MIKKISLSLMVAVLFSACASDSANTTPSKTKLASKNAVASDATDAEIKAELQYEKHIRAIKRSKRIRERNNQKKEPSLKKFCFKDAKSIHYRSSQRCK